MNQHLIQTLRVPTWKKVIAFLVFVPMSFLLLPLFLIIWTAVYLGWLKKKPDYTEEDMVKEFHMDPPGWEEGLEEEDNLD